MTSLNKAAIRLSSLQLCHRQGGYALGKAAAMPLIAGTMPWVKELAIGKGTVH